jgi:ERCC4-type nuclease
MELTIDNRESAIITYLTDQKFPFKIAQLPIGDFLITDEGGVHRVLWERKSYSDLVSSLKDSRFREQKHRMQNSPALIKGYIIEGGYPKGSLHGIKPSTIDSLLLGLTIRDSYSMIYSTGTSHTGELLMKIVTKMKEWITSESASTAHQDSLIQGSIVKKDGLTIETCYLAQLACIPGISLVTSRALSAQWTTLSQFVTFINSPDIAQVKNTLSNFMINGKRLGLAAAEKIIEYLREPKQRVKISIKVREKPLEI